MTLRTAMRSDRPAAPETTPEDGGRTVDKAIGLVGSWTKVHLGLLLVALVLLVIAGQGQSFLYDEWAFLGSRLDSVPLPDRFLLPHNEHWILLPLLAYRAITATMGVGSYWPYLGLLLLLHLGVAHLAWRLMLVTGSKPLVATALAAIFSVLGAAAEDLVWAFQIGFVGSTLLGLTAVYLALTGAASLRKTFGLAGLVLASLATSGVGLAYLVVVPLVLMRRGRRFAVAAFGLPLMVYVPWYVVYGHSLTQPPDVSITAPLAVGAFVIFGTAAALSGYFGFGTSILSLLLVGVPILSGLLITIRDFLAQRAAAARAPLAMFTGAIVFFGIAGLARAGYGLGIAASGRYLYVAMALMLPTLGCLLTRGVGHTAWLVHAVVPIAVTIAFSNIFQLMTYADDTRTRNEASRAVLSAASMLLAGPAPVFEDQRPEPLLAPDLFVEDLRSGHLAAALEGVPPQPLDRLTASLNLQIRVAPDPDRGRAPACQKAPRQGLTIPTSRQSTPRFSLSDTAVLTLSLKTAGSPAAERVMKLPAGTYVIQSLREPANLSIQAPLQASVLAACDTHSGP
jgi:hypothetical protein